MLHLPARQPLSRREALCRMGSGFGMLSFASLIGESLAKADATPVQGVASARIPNSSAPAAPPFNTRNIATRSPAHAKNAIASIRSRATSAHLRVCSSTLIWLTTFPSSRFSSTQHRCGRSIRKTATTLSASPSI